MSDENLVGGKVNVEKYMELLKSESDLKEKLQQLFLKMKKTEKEDKAEISRLQALLEERQLNVQDNSDSLKHTAEVNALKMNFETANSKLNNCRSECKTLEDEVNTKDSKIDELKSELETLKAANKTSVTDVTPAEKEINQIAKTRNVKNSKKDDLTLIKGVGPKLQEKMYKEGITHFEQIAAWEAADIREFDDKLSFKGRIQRDEWVKQAKALMEK